ncbi:WD40/YVTN/BNR-like repeat-containing protein [Paenibacillus flagellatus]|uniref:WD40/YVTN/BNR-like repeat-containing protein n=1 Tax=Paenibacillus flagellatus TaxID=2211139 RepID=UPI0013053CA2|nr:YCF48-related protein [Paenibacillus flagellatus]
MGTFVVISSYLSGGGSDRSPVPPSSSSAEAAVVEKSALIRMIDRTNGWAFGTNVTRTNDGGRTWTDRTPHGYDRSRFEPFPLNGQFAWFVVRPAGQEANWTIYRTADGGHSWSAAALPTTDTWSVLKENTAFALSFTDEKTGILTFISDPAGGPVKTAIYRTTDGGRTWTYVNSIAPEGVLESTPSGMSFSDRSHGFITFFNSRDSRPELYGTSDGGTTWKRLLLELPPDIPDAVFFAERPPQFFGNDRKEGVLPVSYTTTTNEKAGIVWFTTENGGNSWSPAPSPDGTPTVASKDGSAPQGFRVTAASDLTHYWMIDSEAGTLYGTSDAGRHWQALHTSPQLRNAVELSMVDETVGWIRGDGFLLQTEDGGRSWKEL